MDFKIPAILALEDGSLFHGVSIGALGQSSGEVVFNTAMTGYQEILTDPSYAKQIVTLTYPHIGNTGINSEDVESEKIWSAGLVIRDLASAMSNWRAEKTLADYLAENNIVGIAEIDTRRLTRILREKGAQNGCLMAGKSINESAALAAAREFPGLKNMDLAKQVTRTDTVIWDSSVWSLGKGYQTAPQPVYRVVAYDYGVKYNILRMLTARACQVTIVPAKTTAGEVLAYRPDGVFLSNGPGDPEPCDYAIEAIREILASGMPTFGICLGHQLLALASGAKTSKMKFGHHGANHPVQELATGHVVITSQNHGFAVDEATLPDNVQATHRSLFDKTLQGIRRTDVPAFGFQGHPEASPGPHDVAGLFDQFINMMEAVKKNSF
jgi:carbamoyl-phosphate synthase small subunit